jgi:hypothetical protein
MAANGENVDVVVVEFVNDTIFLAHTKRGGDAVKLLNKCPDLLAQSLIFSNQNLPPVGGIADCRAADVEHPSDQLPAYSHFARGEVTNYAARFGDRPASFPLPKKLRRQVEVVGHALEQFLKGELGDSRLLFRSMQNMSDKFFTAQHPLIRNIFAFSLPHFDQVGRPSQATASQFVPLTPRHAVSHELAVKFPGLGQSAGKTHHNLFGGLPSKRMFSQQHAMPTPTVKVQSIHIGHESGAQRVEVDVTDQFQQIDFFLTDDGFVAVLKQVPAALVSKIERRGVSGQQSAHETGEAAGLPDS